MDLSWGRGSQDREPTGLAGAVLEGWGLWEGWAGQVGVAALAHTLCSFIFHASFSGLPDL